MISLGARDSLKSIINFEYFEILLTVLTISKTFSLFALSLIKDG